MEAKDYLAFISDVIHTTIVATVDDEGLPVTAAIDMMDSDENGLYFLTAKGKGFYDRLKKREFLALTAMKGEDTMSSVAVSVRGKVRELGSEKIPELIQKNPYMHEIYPTKESMLALTAFQIYEGSGEWFDLSKKPIERASFTFGGAEEKKEGYFITDIRSLVSVKTRFRFSAECSYEQTSLHVFRQRKRAVFVPFTLKSVRKPPGDQSFV